jgi:Transglutaminase-like superfamily
MNWLRKFLQLPGKYRWLFIRVGSLLVAIQLGLSVVPFRTLYKTLGGRGHPANDAGRDASERQQIIEAVEIASRHAPLRITCLTQALVGRYFLATRGFPVELRIGVTHNEQRHLEAHAWLEHQGQVILGETEDMAHFTPLPPLEL